MPSVYSKRKGATCPPTGCVYVGRPSLFGNRFVVGVDGTHDDCVALHREWLLAPARAALRQRVREELEGRDLVCWCAPRVCHADVLLEVANGEL